MMQTSYPRFDKALFDKLKQLITAHKYLRMKQMVFEEVHYIQFHYKVTGKFDSPETRECRGCLFEVTPNGEYVAPVCRPFEKFFEDSQLESNPSLRINLDAYYGPRGKVRYYEKLDGSIMSSYIHKDRLEFKSNGSIDSALTLQAKTIVDADADYKHKIESLTRQGYTVIFELCTVKMRIIIAHEKDEMTVLGVRHIETGEYWSYEAMCEYFGASHVVKTLEVQDIAALRKQENMEGVVAHYESGLRVKIKTGWYVLKHEGYEKEIKFIEDNASILFAIGVRSHEANYLAKVKRIITDSYQIEFLRRLVECGSRYLDYVYHEALLVKANADVQSKPPTSENEHIEFIARFMDGNKTKTKLIKELKSRRKKSLINTIKYFRTIEESLETFEFASMKFPLMS